MRPTMLKLLPTIVLLCVSCEDPLVPRPDQDELNAPRWVLVVGVSFLTMSAGGNHSCGISNTAALYCWGDNTFGQIGDGTTTSKSSPVLINPGVSYSIVDAGGNHTCAIRQTGGLYCWGLNSSGQLGDATTTNRSSPVLINAGISYGSVSAGGSHTCGIRSSTSGLYCWELNSSGQVGDASTTDRTAPVLVNAGVSYGSVSAGGSHSLGDRSATGAEYAWGNNASGQLGDGTTTNRLSPTAIP